MSLKIIILQEKQRNTTAFEFDFNLKKVEWMAVNTDKMPCDGNSEKPSTTKCITGKDVNIRLFGISVFCILP